MNSVYCHFFSCVLYSFLLLVAFKLYSIDISLSWALYMYSERANVFSRYFLIKQGPNLCSTIDPILANMFLIFSLASIALVDFFALFGNYFDFFSSFIAVGAGCRSCMLRVDRNRLFMFDRIMLIIHWARQALRSDRITVGRPLWRHRRCWRLPGFAVEYCTSTASPRIQCTYSDSCNITSFLRS